MNSEITYLPSGDNGIMIKVDDRISLEVHNKVKSLSHYIENNIADEIVEIIPAYGSILVIYNPVKTFFEEMVNKLKEGERKAVCGISMEPPEVVHIPVCYDEEFGIDLSFVAGYCGLTVPEVIEIHSSKPYLVYMIGFAPGFPYLGGMPEKIATPRLESPRLKMPAGSVGIAGNQTGIYPSDSPGGWRIIGRTHIKLFDPLREVPVLLRASQYIKFDPISKEEFYKIKVAEEARS